MGNLQTTELEETALPMPVEAPPPPSTPVESGPVVAPGVMPPPTAPPDPEPLRVEPVHVGPAAWLRLALAFEFLLTSLVVLEMWTQVGGQGHMDMLPWYLKLSCISLVSWFTVKLTAAVMEQPKTWHRRSRLWLSGVLLMCAAMGGITFYYHLHEVTDQPDTDENASTSVRNVVPRRPPSRL